MRKVKTSTIRHEDFVKGMAVVASDHRLPVATKQKLYDNMLKVEEVFKDNIEEGEVELITITKQELFQFVSVAVLLSLRPITG